MGAFAQGLLGEIERYYDTVPRVFASVEHVGPFTLFVANDRTGLSYYARPTLGGTGRTTVDDVQRVRERQRQLEVAEAFEWVDEVTPGLVDVGTSTGLSVAKLALMVLTGQGHPVPPSVGIEQVMADHPQLAEVNAAIGAGFGNSDALVVSDSGDSLADRLRSGNLRLIGAFDAGGAIGGGFHSPRGQITELAGISVVPRARRQGVATAIASALISDAHACRVDRVFLSAGGPGAEALYSRLGFVTIATACIAEPS